MELISLAARANVIPRKRCNSPRSHHDDPPEPDHHPAPRTARREGARNKEAALDAFIGKKAEIDEMLARLQALSDDHFNAHPDEVGWAMSAPSNTTPAS